MDSQPLPKTPVQLQATLEARLPGTPARLVSLSPAPWRLSKLLRLDVRGRRLRVAYGDPWPDAHGQLQVLVAEFTWPG